MFISKYVLFVPKQGYSPRKKSISIVNAMALELLNYGIIVDKEIIDRLYRLMLKDAYEAVTEILKHFTIGDVNPPLFNGWENRKVFLLDEVIVQIMGYVLQVSGNDLYNPSYLESLKSRIDFKKFKHLKLASEESAKQHLKKISGLRQNKEQQKTAVNLSKEFKLDENEFIKSDDSRVAYILQNGLESILRIKTKPADILRFFAMRKEVEQVILPADVIYDSMTWKERKVAIDYLSSYDAETILEAMGENRTAWVRFFKHIHLFNQKIFLYKNTKFCSYAWVSIGGKIEKIPHQIKKVVNELVKSNLAEVLDTGNLAYRTFASRVQGAIDSKDYNAMSSLVKDRPTYLLRNIATISGAVGKENEIDFSNLCRNALKTASVNVLFSILQIDTESDYRIIDVKGNTIVKNADYSPVITSIQNDIRHQLYNRFGVDGRINVTNKLKNKLVPFLSRNQDLERGSKIPFSKENYLHFFMHWVQTPRKLTDLDHSYLIFKKDGSAEVIAFYNQANSYIAQSGDITNAPAPHGGTEYGVIRLDSIPRDVEYIAPVINVFCGDVFKDLDEAYAGFMFNDDSDFSIKRKHLRYDLSQPAEMNIPFVIDVVNKQIVVVDFSCRNRVGRIAADYVFEVKKVIEASKTMNKLTISEFAKILSTSDDHVALTIKENPTGNKEISPSDLSSVVS